MTDNSPVTMRLDDTFCEFKILQKHVISLLYLISYFVALIKIVRISARNKIDTSPC